MGEVSALSETPLKQYDDALNPTRYALHTALGQSLATDTWLELWLTGSGHAVAIKGRRTGRSPEGL